VWAAREREPDSLRTLCWELDYLLRVLVNRNGTWSASCDGISPATDMLPEAIEVALPCELRHRGRAYWLDERWGVSKGNRVTPFFFSARVVESGDVLSEYLIQFGDTRSGKRLKDISWFYPEKWIFTFRKP